MKTLTYMNGYMYVLYPLLACYLSHLLVTSGYKLVTSDEIALYACPVLSGCSQIMHCTRMYPNAMPETSNVSYYPGSVTPGGAPA